jgi:WD40 repeat protein
MTNPFPGLRSFESSDSDRFFGREAQVDAVLDRLAANRFVAVIGVSGSGKSSLIKAGLLPLLQRRGLPTAPSPNWRILSLRPGRRPVHSLARAIREGLVPIGSSCRAQVRWQRLLLESTQSIAGLGSDFLRKVNGEYAENLLLFVDQFEELFTLGWGADRQTLYEEDENHRRAQEARLFVRTLMAPALDQADVPVYVVMTMRSEFLGDCARFRNLPELLNRTQYLIPRMSASQLRDAIVKPASYLFDRRDTEVSATEIAGAKALVRKVLDDYNDEPRNLPRLQHALMRTWQKWKDQNDPNSLASIEQYESAGGLKGSIRVHAHELYDPLSKKEKTLTELIFRRLTAMDAEDRLVRHPVPLSDLVRVAQAVAAPGESEEIKKLVYDLVNTFSGPEVGFLVKLEDSRATQSDTDPLIDLTHESLIYGWTAEHGNGLRDWVLAEGQSAHQYRLAAAEAAKEKDKQSLWTDPGLAIVQTNHLSQGATPTNKWTEDWSSRYSKEGDNTNRRWKLVQAFLTRSRESQNRTYRQGTQLRYWVLTGISAFLCVLLLAYFTIFLNTKRNDLNSRLRAAEILSSMRSLATLYGSFWPERAALVEIESFKTHKFAENQDLNDWESFERFTKPRCLVPTGEPCPSEILETQPMNALVRGATKEAAAYGSLVPFSDGPYLALIGPQASAFKAARLTVIAVSSAAIPNWASTLHSAVITPDGRYIASCDDNVLSIFKVFENGERDKIAGCSGDLQAISDDADITGKVSRLAALMYEPSASSPTTSKIAVFDLRSRKQLGAPFTISANASRGAVGNKLVSLVLQPLLSPGGTYLAYAVGSFDRESSETQSLREATLFLWRLNGSGHTNISRVAMDGRVSAAFSPDANLLAYADPQKGLVLLDLIPPRPIQLTSDSHTPDFLGNAVSFAFSHDSKRLAVAVGSELRVYEWRPETSKGDGTDSRLFRLSHPRSETNVTTAQMLWSYRYGQPARHIVFSPNDKLLAVAAEESTARVFEAMDGFESVRVSHLKPVNWVDFSKDGAAVYSSSEDGTVRTFQSEHAYNPEVGKIEGCVARDVSWSSEKGGRLAAFCEERNGDIYIRMLNGDRGRKVNEGTNSQANCSLAISQDGTSVAWSCGEKLFRASVRGQVRSLEALGESREFSGESVDLLKEKELTPEVAEALKTGGITTVALSRQGEMLGLGGTRGEVQILRNDGGSWKTAFSGKLLDTSLSCRNPAHQHRENSAVTALAFSKGDPLYLTIGSSDGGVWTLHLDSGSARILRIEKHDLLLGTVTALAFSGDARRIAFGSGVYAGALGLGVDEKAIFVAHPAEVTDVAFSKNGTVASVDRRGNVRIFPGGSSKETDDHGQIRQPSKIVTWERPLFGVQFQAEDVIRFVGSKKYASETRGSSTLAPIDTLSITSHHLNADSDKVCKELSGNFREKDWQIFIQKDEKEKYKPTCPDNHGWLPPTVGSGGTGLASHRPNHP